MKDASDFQHYCYRQVSIHPDSEYAYQRDNPAYAIGLVGAVYDGSRYSNGTTDARSVWARVRFPDGYLNSYPVETLLFVDAKMTNQQGTHFLHPTSD